MIFLIIINSELLYLISTILYKIYQMEKPNREEEVIQLAKDSVNRIKVIEKHEQWKESSSNPCKIYAMEIEGRMASKGICVVNYPIQEVVNFLRSDESLKQLNQKLIQKKTLGEFADGKIKVIYQVYQAVWPVSNRDFVGCGIVTQQQGRFYITLVNCNYDVPEVKGLVRGQIHVGGYIIDKIDEKSCRVTYISNVDIKGSVPAMLKNMISKNQGELASKIGPTMDKLKKK